MPKKFTQEDFVNQVELEHPELEVTGEYCGNKKYVEVRCKIHNYVFNTKPNWLHSGCGCQKCYDDRRGKTLKKSQEQFINEITKIYEGRGYDLSKVVYTGNKNKVCIICPEHGEFYPTPNKILTRGDGCPKCADLLNGLNKRLTTDEFIKRAIKVHGDKYDYSKVDYKTSSDKVVIICPKHGEFEQIPDVHISGCGCPICSSSKLELNVRKLLGESNIEFESQKKFKWLSRQSLDFYLPELNIAIECQGLQHFISVEHFGGDEELNHRIRLDITKKTLCEEHNIKMIYVVDDGANINFNDEKFCGIYKDIMDCSKFETYIKGI